MNPKRLLLVAATTGYQTRMFAQAARRMGVEVTLATDRCHVLDDPWGDSAIPVRFEDAPASADAIAAAGPFDGVLAVADRPTLVAAMAAERLGMLYNSPASVEAARNKYLARQRYEAAGLRVPAYFRVGVDDNPRIAARLAAFPCVLKPLGLSGSRGVIRADDDAAFVAAFHRIAAMLRSTDVEQRREEQDHYIQVESFIEGREYSVEGVLMDGRLHVLAIFDKPDPLDGPFFEETIYVTPSRADAAVQSELLKTAQQAIRALGLKGGPVHVELRHNRQGAWVLEAAARPIGGMCAKALTFSGGMSLEELLVRHALGEDVSDARRSPGASGVMMIPIPKEGLFEQVAGIEEATAVPGITELIVTAKQGQHMQPLPEGSSYLGFLFAHGADPGFVEDALRAGHARLRIRLSTVLPVVGQ
ncbi:MAG: ATP-grasp domain-containing protein [Bryobacteraceae bacterium]